MIALSALMCQDEASLGAASWWAETQLHPRQSGGRRQGRLLLQRKLQQST